MNLIAELKKHHSYAEISERIRTTTGRKYNPGHLANVANGSRALTDGMRFNIMQAYPQFFLQHQSLSGVKIEPISEKVSA